MFQLWRLRTHCLELLESGKCQRGNSHPMSRECPQFLTSAHMTEYIPTLACPLLRLAVAHMDRTIYSYPTLDTVRLRSLLLCYHAVTSISQWSKYNPQKEHSSLMQMEEVSVWLHQLREYKQLPTGQCPPMLNNYDHSWGWQIFTNILFTTLQRSPLLLLN